MPTIAGTPEHQAVLRAALGAVWRRMKAGEGFIYVAERVGTDLIKVGFSLNPEHRMRKFSRTLRLMGYFPASRSAEHAFHKAFRAYSASLGREYYRRSVLAHLIAPRAAA